jgi:hypothetical protein
MWVSSYTVAYSDDGMNWKAATGYGDVLEVQLDLFKTYFFIIYLFYFQNRTPFTDTYAQYKYVN